MYLVKSIDSRDHARWMGFNETWTPDRERARHFRKHEAETIRAKILKVQYLLDREDRVEVEIVHEGF